MLRLRRYEHRIFQTPDGPRLMDCARSQLVPNGQEEFVRQDVLRSLIEDYGYPRLSLLAEEPVARGTENRGRADVLVELPSEFRKREIVVTARSPSVEDIDQPYAEIVRQLQKRLGSQAAVRFVEVPASLLVDVDGAQVSCKVLGFKEEGSALGLWLQPENPIAGLPPELCIHVLGYGLTASERAVARRLGLAHVAFTDPERKSFEESYGELFDFDETLGIHAGGCVSENATRGWVVLRANSSRFGVLALIEVGALAWGTLFRARLNQMRQVPLLDGRVADRDNLSSLLRGDRVFVLPFDDGEPMEGRVEEIGDGSVSVDCGKHGVVEATLLMQLDRAWVMGRVPLEPEQSGHDQGSRSDNRWRTFIVVECKAPKVSYSEEIKQQGLRYARTRGAKFLVLTNGDWSRTFLLTANSETEVEDIPSYEHAIANRDFAVSAVQPDPLDQPIPSDSARRPAAVRFHARYRAVVGADTPEPLWRAILVVDDLLRAKAPLFDVPQEAFGITLVEDLGLRWHEPGNAAGGTFPGDYRDFLLRDDEANEILFGLRVSSTMKTVGHATWGNRTGLSMLTCCLSFGSVYHPVLQYRLDRFMEVRGDRLLFWHSGAATVGLGALKHADMVDFVTEHAPSLVVGTRIQLGSLPARSDAGWVEMRDWTLRLARYVLLRYRFKEEVRGRRRPRSRTR